MSAVTSSAISSTVGERSKKRKFKLQLGGTLMATRGKKMSSSRRGSSRGKSRPMTRGKGRKR